MLSLSKDSKIFINIDEEKNFKEPMGALHALGVNDQNALITTANCDALHFMFNVKQSNPAYMPAKKEIKRLMDLGLIRLVYQKTNNLGTLLYAIPWELTGGKSSGVTINASAFFTDKEDFNEKGKVIRYSIKDETKLVEVLNTAFIVLRTAEEPERINTDTSVKKALMDLYAEMMLMVLSRQSTISADKASMKTIRYYINNFFSHAILKVQIEEVYTQLSATVAGLNESEKMVADEKKRQSGYNDLAYADINTFLLFLKVIHPNLGDVSVSNLIRKYNIFFNSSSVFAIDFLPYLAASMVSGATGCVALANNNFKKQFNHLIKINSVKMLNLYNRG